MIWLEASSASSTPLASTLDPESAEWLASLRGEASEEATQRLRKRLLKVARSEVNRRRSQLPFGGPELDDIADHAASDAVIAVLGKLDQFRGESRFTTWASKFAIFEVSNKVGRHFWRSSGIHLDPAAWDRLPDRFGLNPARESESRELIAALRRAVQDVLSDRQRRIFEAIVLNEVPLDVLVLELDSNRNAIYKSLFDARRKLRAELVTNGYLDQ
jgi:RNA polymerase sigma-70 factor, ECF subfamily